MNFIFPYIGNVIIPTDEVIFFRGLGQPPTSYGGMMPDGAFYINPLVYHHFAI